ncbi:hypothetical protein D1007_28587 [Hordeum vulgare]|nr:hypothetical protein D1007_28587 [Hordeum vulgare]
MMNLRQHLLMEEDRRLNSGKEKASYQPELHLREYKNNGNRRNWNKRGGGQDLREKINHKRDRDQRNYRDDQRERGQNNNNNNGGYKNNNSNHNNSLHSTDKRNYKCHNCGTLGHFRSECTKKRKLNSERNNVNKDDSRKANHSPEVAEIGAMSDDSHNSLIEDLRTLKIKYSSNSSSENNNDKVGTHEDSPSIGKAAGKIILSPIAVRCAGRPPSLRKESKVEKLIRQANEKKKKIEQREKKKAAIKEKKEAEKESRSLNLKNKRSTKKGKSSRDDIPEQNATKHVESFDLGIKTVNINLPQESTTVSFGDLSTMVMPPILGEYTSMLFQVQQGSTIVPSSAELHFDGIGGLNNTLDRSWK